MPIKTGSQDAPSRSGILSETISIVSTSLQQKQSISLFLLIINHISTDHFCSAFCRFPILICNKAAADSSVQAQTEMVKNGRRNTSLPHVFSSE